jgi:membrane protein required for colicin V production
MTGSYLDAGVLALALISGLLAMYRGFSREVLSIGSWLAAAGAAAYFIFFQKPLAEHISTQMGVPNVQITQIAVGAVIFLIALIVVHLVTSRISDLILDSRVGMIDRVLGFMFGVARAFLLVLVPYMGLNAMVDKKEQHPEWVRNSWSIKMIEGTGDQLGAYLKAKVEAITAKKAEKS